MINKKENKLINKNMKVNRTNTIINNRIIFNTFQHIQIRYINSTSKNLLHKFLDEKKIKTINN
jgi:hypothetical protein